jgi:hypothetical protein
VNTDSRAPRWRLWFVGSLVPVVLVLQFWALAGLVATVSPPADPTPVYVLGAVLVIARFKGASAGWLRAAGILALIMSLEWVAWRMHMDTRPISASPELVRFQTYALIDRLLPLYVGESCLLLILCVIAQIRSFIGICRVRRQATTVDEAVSDVVTPRT